MSLRSRIALTIFLLEAMLIAAVLYITLTHSMQSVEQQISSSQQVTIDLLGDLSKAAFITEEFNELQTFIKGTASDPNIKTVLIGDVDDHVVAATNIAMLGGGMPVLANAGNRYWREIEVRGTTAKLGHLAIEFSQNPLRSAYQKTLNLGMAVAGIGIVVIALVAWLIGHVLTRRLWRLAVAADKVACGERDLGVFLPGNDEVARVGRAFNSMVARLHKNMKALEASRDRLIKPTEAISEGFALWSADDRLVLCNRPFRKLFETMDPPVEIGMSHDRFTQLIQNHLLDRGANDNQRASIGQDNDPSGQPEGMLKTVESELSNGRWISHCEFRTPEGELVGIYSDITSRKATEATIRYQATHDALTGLPNRANFEKRLEGALADARRVGKSLAVAFLDLDRFKLVNDGLGHRIGDDLLIAVADRLKAAVGDRGRVARMGGNEFILLLWDVKTPDQVRAEAKRLLKTLRSPFLIGGHELHVTASLGLSLSGDDARNADQLLKAADAALYQAKSAGRDRWQLDHSTADKSALEQLMLESQLRRAVEQKQFFLVYQPQVNLRSGQIVGVEALVRWQNHDGAFVPPDEFISLAEETGLIHDLGLWILETACEQHRAWRDAGLQDLRLAVNISPYQLKRQSLEQDITAVLDETQMPLQHLELELTETALMQEGETTKLLERLTAKGLSIALDDFGTGYSSLSYLRRFPIDRIKIDRSFVCDISGSQSDGALARAVIMLAHGLNVGVIAEGVETAAQLSLLRHFGCDEAQGYLLGEPVSGDVLADMISGRQRQPASLALAAV
ncbi:MAG: EAL domain-containing protein [Geminicoccales bacterium]